MSCTNYTRIANKVTTFDLYISDDPFEVSLVASKEASFTQTYVAFIFLGASPSTTTLSQYAPETDVHKGLLLNLI